MAQALRAEFPDLEIVGNEGGAYRTGAFEVTLDGMLLFSYFEEGSFPESSDILKLVKKYS